ncbi:alginate export family protein [Vineibacter terrae]|uniref:alginate export family protein n=1 Tax=Vineibacter terrae TaxID=2586908 RepID=UPI002E33EE61|nr:alginate export family protein [Vineibacter terrae]HEX2891778.1 alginate export family protein [Vineibacter terrae]
MMRRVPYIGLLLAILLPGLAWAQDAARPAFKTHRFDEDWRVLCADPALRTEPLDRLKCLKLGADVSLTLGGELRERFEAVRNPGFGLQQDHDHVFLHRVLLHADLRIQNVARLFLQFGSLTQSGREGAPSSTDVDRLDLMQGFVDLMLPLDDARLTLRGGRQEVSFGASRLVSVRDSPNARRAFDGGRAFLTAGGFRVDAIYLRPVLLSPKVFDDETNKTEKLWGVYGTGPVAGPLKADLYYLGFERDRGRFAAGAAPEHRHTLGVRLFGKAGAFDWDVEGVFQFGSFGNRDIRAWTIASDWGVTFESLKLQPRLGLKADIASGDRNLADGRLGTFNALYPRLPYFSDANLVAPANFFDIHPVLELQLAPTLQAEIGWNALWRQTTADAIYAPPLSPIAGTAGQPGRFIGQQVIVGIEWRVIEGVTLAGQYVHFVPGRALRRIGGGTTDFVFVSAAYKF